MSFNKQFLTRSSDSLLFLLSVLKRDYIKNVFKKMNIIALLKNTLLIFFILLISCKTNVNTDFIFNNEQTFHLQQSYKLNYKYSLRRGYIKNFDQLSPADLIKIFSKPFFGRRLKKRIVKYLPLILKKSKEFNIDPFWAFSIAMVESHFHPWAISHKYAHGLYQVKAATAIYLKRLMRDKTDLNIYKPEQNITLGIYYLSKLKRRFKRGKYATVAYNMGPTWVSRALRHHQQVGVKNLYLNKVRKVYFKVIKNYLKIRNIKSHFYKNTLVVSFSKRSSFHKIKKNFVDHFFDHYFSTYLVKQRLIAYNL